MLENRLAQLDEPMPRARTTTQWQRIAEALRNDILEGRHRPGERLPNEAMLAERFAVNRHTIRQAVQELAREGHLHVRQGTGTFVRNLVLDYALRKRTRMTENLAEIGESARRELLAHRVAPASEFAAALGISPRRRSEWLCTRASVRGRAISMSTSVFPGPRLLGIAEIVARVGTITAALRELGVADYTRARSVVSARLPSRHEADALARSITQPVLVVQYCNVDAAGEPVEAGTTVFAADAVQLTVQPDVEPS